MNKITIQVEVSFTYRRRAAQCWRTPVPCVECWICPQLCLWRTYEFILRPAHAWCERIPIILMSLARLGWVLLLWILVNWNSHEKKESARWAKTAQDPLEVGPSRLCFNHPLCPTQMHALLVGCSVLKNGFSRCCLGAYATGILHLVAFAVVHPAAKTTPLEVWVGIILFVRALPQEGSTSFPFQK